MRTIEVQGVVTFKEEIVAVKGLDDSHNSFYVERSQLDGYPDEFLLSLKQLKLVDEIDSEENMTELKRLANNRSQDKELIKSLLSELSLEYMMYQSDRENCYYRVFATIHKNGMKTRVAGVVIDTGGIVSANNKARQLCVDKYEVEEHQVLLASVSQITGSKGKDETEISRESYKDFYKRYGKEKIEYFYNQPKGD